MRKKIKTCIGIFIFILSLFLYNSIALADHPNCGSTSCAKFIVESYLCPNSEATDDDSAQSCMNAIMDGDTSGMEKLTSESTVPFKYDNTKSTLIAVASYLDPYQLDRIQAFTTTLKFDYDNLQLIATMYNDDPSIATDYPYSVKNKRKTGQANLTMTYTGDECEYCFGDHITTTADYEDGLVLLNYSTKTAGDYLLPHETAEGPYPTYYVFKVRDTATAGTVTIKAKEESVNIYGVYMEASRYNEDGNSSSHFFVTENSTFKLGDGLEVQNPITNLTVYKDKNKNSNEIYKFGVPGGSGNTAYPMEFSASENAYDLYLPSGTTSIYIYAESSDGASVTPEVREKAALYASEGRAYGPHGKDLVIANSIDNYDEEFSCILTDLAVKANIRVRDLGFKPYIAPALSSAAIPILLTLRGEWHYGSIYFGSRECGAFLGIRNRMTADGWEYEDIPLPETLYERIKRAYINLCKIR